MKKILTFCAALALSATGVMADAYIGDGVFMQNSKGEFVPADVVVTPIALPDNAGIAFNIDVTGVESWDGLGSGNNTVILFDSGLPGEALSGVGWDVVMSSIDPSWLSEMDINFDDSGQTTGGINLGISGTGAPGVGEANASGGIVKFADVPLADIPLPDGLVRIEFFESYDDAVDTIDGIWDSGTITVQVTPEPASLALLALGGIAVLRRRS